MKFAPLVQLINNHVCVENMRLQTPVGFSCNILLREWLFEDCHAIIIMVTALYFYTYNVIYPCTAQAIKLLTFF